MSRQTAAALAQRCADAYSFDRYANWSAVAAKILALGFNEHDTEEIMRSKWTRWAADGSTARYGRVPAHVAADYVKAHAHELRSQLGITPPASLTQAARSDRDDAREVAALVAIFEEYEEEYRNDPERAPRIAMARAALAKVRS